MTYTGKCQAKKKNKSQEIFLSGIYINIHKTQANIVFDLDIYPK